jgi:hypothetical protein
MTDYKKLMEQAVKDGKTKRLTVEIFSFEAEGDTIVGRLIRTEDYVETDYKDNPCKKYILETNDGLMSCVIGARYDRMVDHPENIGQLLEIEYLGKELSKKGVQYNVFRIMVAPMPKLKG